jgi:hypothetical protein
MMTMMKRTAPPPCLRPMLAAGCLAFALLAALAMPALAQDGGAEGAFAEGSQAESWGLLGEEKARFAGTVVDILCELTGDCPANCGGGTRQLGILREADDRLILVSKNGQPAFNGAVADLLPHCGDRIEVDGLLVGDATITPTDAKFFQVQRIRGAGGDWQKANRWTKVWAEKHPDAKGEGPWFRRDPRVLRQIEEEGYLGLGPAADAKFIAETY